MQAMPIHPQTHPKKHKVCFILEEREAYSKPRKVKMIPKLKNEIGKVCKSKEVWCGCNSGDAWTKILCSDKSCPAKRRIEISESQGFWYCIGAKGPTPEWWQEEKEENVFRNTYQRSSSFQWTTSHYISFFHNWTWDEDQAANHSWWTDVFSPTGEENEETT